MRIVKANAKPSAKKNVKADTKLRGTRRAVRAGEEVVDEQASVATVDPAATDMLFEAEDVAELVAEVTGDEVTVEVDDESDAVIFTVGEEEFTVEPEGDEEILEASRKSLRGKSSVKASRKPAPRAAARKQNLRRR